MPPAAMKERKSSSQLFPPSSSSSGENSSLARKNVGDRLFVPGTRERRNIRGLAGWTDKNKLNLS
jgi:hypothetical protein